MSRLFFQLRKKYVFSDYKKVFPIFFDQKYFSKKSFSENEISYLKKKIVEKFFK